MNISSFPSSPTEIMKTSVNSVLLLFLLFPSLEAVLLDPCLSQDKEGFERSLKQVACSNTKDPESCLSRLQAECQRDGHHGRFSLLNAAIRGTINEAIQAVEVVSRFSIMSDNVREQAAIKDCIELLDYTVDELGWSLAEMGSIQLAPSNFHREGNLGAWLSAALSNQDTCLEGFEGTDGRLKHHVRESLTQVTQLVSNVLAVYKRMQSIVPLKPPENDTIGSTDFDFPPWVTDEEQELAKMSPRKMRFDAVVASDGSGRYGSVMEAVNNAPDHRPTRYIILVKRGVYRENVELKKKKTNIMLVGEGMGLTVISGSRSFMDGWTTFRSATFAVSGQGFIARDITFRNTAGPQRHQAVALRVDSDRSAFFRCSIEGYQDTLYAHSLRQFYRDCNIYGTVDFIFGNGNAVIQHCKIFTRKPLPYQKVTITAQGRKDPAQTTGFSIQDSYVFATSPTYLGRPWKQYSRTVFMQSYLSGQVQPAGWLEWYGNFALNTLYYGEYRNYGPGSALNGRVRWPGYHAISDAAVASFFTVRRFIDGASWLPSTRVPFTADLIK